ncbi:nuclear speckle splicing regulatory protein 1-like isoform X1 [Sycon ciliatum]|uniref:nuclear speckle splicing regulatory protein 1-like isoform X1 n=1 Tax=Sycon ciliatum TaxID=27933 RepID=UPI0020ACF465|eukprot:scpid71938/ scgid19917/ Nuclear speckle splicing regulatory protein 1; Coiled-coil domain-containing protein 55; Nuclear speckle-related protein 70
MAAPKKYGLIIPKSKQQAVKKPMIKPSSAFGDDSDDENPGAIKASINRSLLQESGKKATNREAKIVMSRALEQDPSVYQYDEVYDKMTNDRHCVAEAKKGPKDRKPKYVHQLLKNAAARKLDDERRQERQAHREREKEGDEFGDKDAYITPSFLKKQAELKAAEEAARRKEAADAANDVTQKGNLNDFYRNLLTRKTSSGGQWSKLESTEGKPSAGPKKTPSAATSKQEGDAPERRTPAAGTTQHHDDDDDHADQDDADDADDRDDDQKSSSSGEESESEVEAEEIEAAMEQVKSKADREAEELLAKKRAREELQKKRQAEEAAEGPAAKLDRRNDDTSILSARERYLQRKREQAAKVSVAPE